MKIDFQRFEAIENRSKRIDALKEHLQGMNPNDPIYISDLIVREGGIGTDTMVALAEVDAERKDSGKPEFKWKIHVLRDCWGNPPSPGDVITIDRPKNMKTRDGFPVSSDELNAAMTDGSYEERFVKGYRFEVDEKGCIECNRRDAVYFLKTHGVHGKTRRGLPGTGREHSRSLREAPNGQKLHQWNWLYAEMDQGMYSKLKKIKPVDGAKRGQE